MMTTSLSQIGVRCAALVLVTASAVNCGIEKQTAPALAGPSEFAQSVTLTATPDTLIQDGSSEATVRAVVRDVSGQPVRGLQVTFTAQWWTPMTAPEPTFSATSAATDANGVAETKMIAPPPPVTAQNPSPLEPIVMVYATPVGGNFANQVAHSVAVRIIPPAETPRGGGPVDAVIRASRNTVLLGESITFDASLSTYQGVVCSYHCDYIWEFPEPMRGMKIDRKFTAAGTFTVWLTVTDEHGNVDRDSVLVRVIDPDTD